MSRSVKKGPYVQPVLLKRIQEMNAAGEEITKVIKQMEEGLRMVSQMINGAADSMSQITANIGKRMAV